MGVSEYLKYHFGKDDEILSEVTLGISLRDTGLDFAKAGLNLPQSLCQPWDTGGPQ